MNFFSLFANFLFYVEKIWLELFFLNTVYYQYFKISQVDVKLSSKKRLTF